ncbi:MAG: guanine deaminase [Geminicoccaceae bacterium]
MTGVCGKTLRATLFQAPAPGAIEAIEDALVTVDEAGVIADVQRPSTPSYDRVLEETRRSHRLIETGRHRFLLPGFVDLHIHAPQFPQLGKSLDVPLEVWLQKHTFPLEARYADPVYASTVYDRLVDTLLANGTTTAVYFGTTHVEATSILAETCLAKGQRALIGKVAMDDPDQCPDYYRDADADTALEETDRFIRAVQTLPGNDSGLVRPVVTPRFIPSCTHALLEGLGEITRETGCHVQTHCSESDWEHGFVLDRYGVTDSRALDDLGLLTRRTVLAHGNFITPDDMALIQARGAGIAHCPLSNVYFSNAVFPLRRALEKGLRVGLGTDISGGPSASLLDSCRSAVSSSRLLEDGVDPTRPAEERGVAQSRIDFRHAFHLATAGGGDVLDLPVGRFEPGCFFDAVLVDAEAPSSPLLVDKGTDSVEEILQRIVMGATRSNIDVTWVAGRETHRRS